MASKQLENRVDFIRQNIIRQPHVDLCMSGLPKAQGIEISRDISINCHKLLISLK